MIQEIASQMKVDFITGSNGSNGKKFQSTLYSDLLMNFILDIQDWKKNQKLSAFLLLPSK